MRYYSVAIDGPSGTGKSTVARAVAQAFGWIYVDTGAIYRALGLYVCGQGIASGDATGIIAVMGDADIVLRHKDGEQRVFLNGEDVSEEIRTPTASIYASDVSKVPQVRAHLLKMQRDMALENHVVMDGRDIGTVVLPGADIKIFLTASQEERVTRRYLELRRKNPEISRNEVAKDLAWRDENDSNRDCAPLRAADDAVVIDTTGMGLEAVVSAVKKLIRGVL